MNTHISILRYSIAAAVCLTALVSACSPRDAATDEHRDHAATGEASGTAIGSHGGRLLVSDDFALEVAIYERGVPPEWRLYPSLKGQPLSPDAVQATITLTRINGLPGGTVDRYVFSAHQDYLLGSGEVYEPHSFSVNVQAVHAGRRYQWRYESPEGQVTIDPAIAAAQGVATAAAGPGQLRERLSVYGTIEPNAERVRAVTARYPGIVRTVSVAIGDQVKAGQTLATIESNESLQIYAITAPLSGVVTRRDSHPGEAVSDGAMFEIADLTSVWAQLSVFPRDRSRLKPGQAVSVAGADGAATAHGVIDYVSPLGGRSQATTARVVLDNTLGHWTPGQFVNVSVALAELPVALVVPLSALQQFRDWDVVFVAQGDTYQAQPLKLGRRDDEHVEVLSGLVAGAQIVVANSYLVKADIEKSGASHDH